MKRKVAVAAVLALAAGFTGCREDGAKTAQRSAPPVATERGGELFRDRCAPCHPNGGNTMNPRKTLHAAVLADHGIRSSADIVTVMRHPGSGMPAFDQATISDQDAKLIADYVLASFR